MHLASSEGLAPNLTERSIPSHDPAERGAILVAVMLMMVVLLGLGMSGLFLTKSSVQMLANTNLRNQALYVAEAGLERARDILNGPVAPDLTALLGGAGHVANPADEIPSAVDSVVAGRSTGICGAELNPP